MFESVAKRFVEDTTGIPWAELFPLQQHAARESVLPAVREALNAAGPMIARRAWAEGWRTGNDISDFSDNPYPDMEVL